MVFENSVFTSSLTRSLKLLMRWSAGQVMFKSKLKPTASNSKKISVGKGDVYITYMILKQTPLIWVETMNQTLRTDEWQRCAWEVSTNTMCQEAMSWLRATGPEFSPPDGWVTSRVLPLFPLPPHFRKAGQAKGKQEGFDISHNCVWNLSPLAMWPQTS